MSKISAGSYDLNKWLHGGYESDIITVIYGPPGTGKTNFCLLTAVSQAKKGNKIIYIDTEGGFNIERIKQIYSKQEILKNIFLLKPMNFQEQKDEFVKLSQYLKNVHKIGLIVVDGFTVLYRLSLADARNKGEGEIKKINSELIEQTKILSEIARKKNIPVLVTNQMYKWEEMDRMVGGDILKYWAKCEIELVNDKGGRIAYLRKHRGLPEKSLEFNIINEGVKKRRLFS